MKEKIAILTDSSSSIYQKQYDFDNLFMIDLPCFIGEEIFTEFMRNGDAIFYEAMGKTDLIPKTSQPSIGETLDKFEYIKSLGYTHVIYLPISKELSGTYHNGHASRDLITGLKIEIVDTRRTASLLGAIAFEAAQMAKDGQSVSEIIKKVHMMRDTSVYYVTVNDLSSLVKNGRLSNAKSIIAKIFKIKPIIKLNEEGKLVSLATVRTFKKAMREIVDIVKQEFHQENGILHISYGGVEEDLKYMISLVNEVFPGCQYEVYFVPSTVVAHLGLSSIALGYVHY